MLLPVVVFLLSAVLPVFFGRLRAAPFWVSVQALALAWALSARHPEVTMHSLIGVIEVLLVRGALAPFETLRGAFANSSSSTALP